MHMSNVMSRQYICNVGMALYGGYTCVDFLACNTALKVCTSFFRQFQEGVLEMTCTVTIDANLLTYPLGYKYVVYSPRMLLEDDCFEYLHSFAGWHHQNHNRCLKINPSDLESM